jgi:hypothetical protein
VVFEGFVEYGFSGYFATPVSPISADTGSVWQALALSRSNTEFTRTTLIAAFMMTLFPALGLASVTRSVRTYLKRPSSGLLVEQRVVSDVQFEQAVCRAWLGTHQNATASTFGLPCKPLTTCELRTTSKLLWRRSMPAPTANCCRDKAVALKKQGKSLPEVVADKPGA